jgi:transcriptional regulatory protein RtcR
MPKPLVVIGSLGTRLDVGARQRRWVKWRPSICAVQQLDRPAARFELLHPPRYEPHAQQILRDLGEVAPDTDVRLHPQGLRDPWDFEEVFAALHDFARAYPFQPEREDYLLHITTGTHVYQICCFLLAESRHIPARLLQTEPTHPGKDEEGNKIPDPGRVRIIDLDLSRYDAIAARFGQERRDAVSFLKQGIDTRSAAFNALIDRIERVALASDDPILLVGPTGAGKTQLASRIAELKLRGPGGAGDPCGPFVPVNCATLRGEMAMSALFGHVRGAFTGAQSDRKGLLRSADGGVLFLDEIAELGADEQAMLLRAVESGRFLPVGSDKEVQAHFQLIAGTNRDLADAVRTGAFRADLLARLDLWTFPLPGLAQRREDIEPNLDYELESLERQWGRRVTINAEARARFLAFATSAAAPWSRNFRDLNGAVRRMATLSDGGRIALPQVREELGRLERAWGATAQHSDDIAALRALLGPEGFAALDRFERVQLADVVAVCRQSASLSAAGRELFAASRARRKSVNDADRLRKYLGRFGLSFGELGE